MKGSQLQSGSTCRVLSSGLPLLWAGRGASEQAGAQAQAQAQGSQAAAPLLRLRSVAAAASCLGPRPPDEAVVRRSGTSFHLGPSDTPPAVSSLEWKAQLRSEEGTRVLFTWRDGGSSEGERWGSGRHRLRLSTSPLSLLFEAAQQDDSGTYSLEVTSEAGAVRTHCFLVSVLGECPARAGGGLGPA